MTTTRPLPSIDTTRLVLRPPLLSDFDGYAALWAGEPQGDCKPLRQSPLADLNKEDAWARLLRFIEHWAAFGYGLFLAFERSSDVIVAEAGLAQCHRDIGEGFDRAPEAMWKVDDRHQGCGIASETMLNVMRWFDAREREDRVVCMIPCTNIPTRRVAIRLGFQPFGEAFHRGSQVLLFERMKTNRFGPSMSIPSAFVRRVSAPNSGPELKLGAWPMQCMLPMNLKAYERAVPAAVPNGQIARPIQDRSS